jgi:hypothetical protein
MTHAELELTLRDVGDGHAADLRFCAPDSAATADLALGVPLSIDPPALLALTNDWPAYGRTLTNQLFADPRMREAWASARGFVQGANTPLSLRLRIDPGADALHALRWELLLDPASGMALCRSERVRFARTLDTTDMSPLTLPARADLRALVLVANPTDLEEYNLTPVDVDGELARARAAFADLPTAVLARSPAPRDSTPPLRLTERGLGGEVPPHGQIPTLENLLNALRAGHPLLSLVCHGSMLRGQPILWLEREDGSCDRVPGTTLVQRIADLDPARRPLLVILVACQTAGRDQNADVLAALGPQLARAGVGAVIGMQGNVPMALVETLLPRLLAELCTDGQIDRALALARAALPDDQPWWMPVLFMRVHDGRLWHEVASTPTNPVPQVAEGLGALIELLQTPAIHDALAEFRNDFIAARAQVADVIALKDVHDLLHTLQFQCYIPLTREARSFPDDDLACDSIADYGLTLRSRTIEIQAAFARAPEVLGEGAWVRDLASADDSLQQALAQRDPQLLRKVIWQINRVLAVQPSYINANLIARARNLRLRNLVEAMGVLHAQLRSASSDTGRLARFTAGVAALGTLRQQIEQLIGNHDAWQAIDREVRRISESLRHDISELEFSWPDLREHLATLALDDASWAQALRAEVAQLDAALAGTVGLRPTAIFQRCSRIIGERFFQVDVDLKRLCSQLRELSDPLTELERMLG